MLFYPSSPASTFWTLDATITLPKCASQYKGEERRRKVTKGKNVPLPGEACENIDSKEIRNIS
jgi:hypothetical protein